MPKKRPRPVVLVIVDGWGISPSGQGNPIAAAHVPKIDALLRDYPTVTLLASGSAVGLGWGDQGNSEVGHLAIGTGRVIFQSLPRINHAIKSGQFFRNHHLLTATDHVKKNGSTLHIVGIISSGNVHGSIDHVIALIKLARRQHVSKVMVHAILDGRDVRFNSAEGFLAELQGAMDKMLTGKVASISGRYFAMDRDNRWDRIEKAYRAMTGTGESTASDPAKAIKDSYLRKVFDEEFVPTMLMKKDQSLGPVTSGDAVIFANFRPERIKQLASAFIQPAFDKFPRQKLENMYYVTMTSYGNDIEADVAFPPETVDSSLAKVISDSGLKQLHIAETEKYGHITYYLNGMKMDPFPGEDRVIVPSPAVPSYDQTPAMSAPLITQKVVDAIESGVYDFIAVNFANTDMVGHTGKFEETKTAFEVIDGCIGRIADATLAVEGVVFITADHGNAEETIKLDYSGDIDKEHSTNPVPFIIVGKSFRGATPASGESASDIIIGGNLSILPPVGMLSDVAPTILKLMGLEKPQEMTGNPLI
jgi:2,3-bisphosphoglycerate-independent phosphoglycerate mutase